MMEPTIHDLNEQPVVLVTWVDIISHGGWVEMETISEAHPQTMLTYGKIIAETPDYISLAGTWSEECEETFGDINVIPRGVITSIKILSGS